MARTLLSIAVLALAAVAAVAEDVLILTAGNFSEAVKKHDKLIVEFYAPWCGHCKKLEPEWEAAAGKLKDEGITLAKVDAADDTNKPLAEKFEVQGFPTIKIFRGHKEKAEDYEGPRETEGIVSFLKKQFGPAFTEITTADAATKATTPSEEISVVGVFPAGASSDAAAAFKAAAETLRNEATFVFTTDAKLVKDAGGKQALVLYRDFDDKTVKFDGKFEKAAISKFVEKNSVPRLTSLDRSNKNKKALQKIFSDKQPKVLGVMASDDKKLKDFQEALVAINEAYDDLHVLYMDPKENAGAMGFFGASSDKLPVILIHDPKNDGKFNSGVLEISKMKAYVADFKAGKIEKTVKSEDPPSDNSGPVKVVVAKTFKEIVFSGKNVLIEFYAPWCGHCKSLEPIYKELGEAYEGEDKVVIAKMDATANDVEDEKFKVKGFPTIMFVSDKGEVKNYEGGRTLDDFKAFIDKEVGLKSGEDKKEDKKKEDKKEDKKQEKKEDKKEEKKEDKKEEKKEDKKEKKGDKKKEDKKKEDKKKDDKKDEL